MIMVKRTIFWLLCPFYLWAQEPDLAPNDLAPFVVTAQGGFAEPLAESAWSINQLDTSDVEAVSRSMPEALSGIPSVMIQKTALGQSSPYIRGLTGYHNVLLVDGIRLNHSAMRSGPNQYWSTVELFGSDQIEVLRGTHGTIYGSDAVGGVVNLLSSTPHFSAECDQSIEFLGRLSSAEDSWTVGLSGEISSPDWYAEVSHAERSFGDLEGGDRVGMQKDTGYDSSGTQFRIAKKISDDARFTLGFQHAFMEDVPRTHKTINGLNWEGLSVGKEIWRRLDQERNLYYGKIDWSDIGGWADSGQISLSQHRHDQERNRRREKGNDFIDDRQGFQLDDFGVSIRFETEEIVSGKFSYGLDFHFEDLSSFGSDYNNSSNIERTYAQGPLAADATYERYSGYLQYSYEMHSGWFIQPGIRYSSVRANLKKFFEKNSDASTMFAPEISNYNELVGSLKLTKEISDDLFLFGGLSQGFRAPSLYDLTSTDETSAVEKPDTKLDPEDFLQVEVGVRGKGGSLDWQTAYYYTWIKDMIVRSPVESGKSDVLKSNGDGYIQGLELQLGYQWNPSWRSEVSFSWMDSGVEQLLDDNTSGTVAINGRNYLVVEQATTRLMPLQTKFVTSYDPISQPWQGEFSVLAVGKADNLSLKDETDRTRIPERGTPSYVLFGVKGVYEWNESSLLTLAIENLLDEDYRVHGSGLNGAGRNFILSFSQKF
jgi:hemoglobin/transferrin/lactoferrin receptor protein